MNRETGREKSMDKESVCGPREDLSGRSVDGRLGREVRDRTWVMSDFVAHAKEFPLYPDGHGTHRGWERSSSQIWTR